MNSLHNCLPSREWIPVTLACPSCLVLFHFFHHRPAPCLFHNLDYGQGQDLHKHMVHIAHCIIWSHEGVINGLRVLIWPILLLCLFAVRLQSLTSDCDCEARAQSGEVTLTSLKCWAVAGGKPLLPGAGVSLLQTGWPGLDGTAFPDLSVSGHFGLSCLSATGKSGWSHSWVTSMMFQVLLGLVQWCRCLRFVLGSHLWCTFCDGIQQLHGSCQRRAHTSWTRTLICLVNLRSGVWRLYLHPQIQSITWFVSAILCCPGKICWVSVLNTWQEALAGLSAHHAGQTGAFLPAMYHSRRGWVDQSSRYRGSCVYTVFKLSILFQTRFCLALWTKCPHCMCGLNLPKALLVSCTSILIQRCEGIWYVPGPEFPFYLFSERNFIWA